MNKRYLLILIILLFLNASVIFAAPINKKFNLELSSPGEPVKVDVDIYRGAISVEGYKGEVIEIVAEFTELEKISADSEQAIRSKKIKAAIETKLIAKSKENKSSKKRSIKGLKRIKNNTVRLEIKEKNNKVHISSDMRDRLVSLKLRVPARSNLELSVFSGKDIKVSNISGPLEINNHNGNINLIGVNGPIVAETFRGEITVDFKSIDDSNPTSFTTHNGSIDLSIPKKSKTTINIKTYRGEIYSGLDSEFIPEDEKEGSKDIVIGGLMSTKMNGGGQHLSLSSFSGDIYIRKK